MSDVMLQKFYNDVKDPNWSNIETYNDFCKLPSNVQKECYEQHGLKARLNQIENPDYWHGLITIAWQYENITYVPVCKCASSYYSDLFENTYGWTKIHFNDIDFESTNAFGLVMHPLDRYLKGVAEWLYRYQILDSYTGNLENDQRLVNIMGSIQIPDQHCMPLYMQYGKYVDKINWIPMDVMSEQQVTNHIEKFLETHGCNIKLPVDRPKLNSSPPDKLNLYRTIKKLYPSKIEMELFYYFFAKDLNFYRTLIQQYSSI